MLWIRYLNTPRPRSTILVRENITVIKFAIKYKQWIKAHRRSQIHNLVVNKLNRKVGWVHENWE